MSRRNLAVSERNYWNDRRVRVRSPKHEPWKLDESRMVVTIALPEFCEAHGEGEHDDHPECYVCRQSAESMREDGSPVEELAVPFEWAICSTCSGRGSHVNPSVDCDGLTREDFDEDPDFAEAYMSGRYDVTCGECNGRRVVPELKPHTPDQKALVASLEASERDAAQYEREVRAERAFGC